MTCFSYLSLFSQDIALISIFRFNFLSYLSFSLKKNIFIFLLIILWCSLWTT